MAVYGGLCYGKVGLLDTTETVYGGLCCLVGLLDTTMFVYGGLCYGKVGLLDTTVAVSG